MCPEQGCNQYLDEIEVQWFETFFKIAEEDGYESGHHYRISYKCPNPKCGGSYYRNVVLHEDNDLS
jgi:hypothetical protein